MFCAIDYYILYGATNVGELIGIGTYIQFCNVCEYDILLPL